MLKSKWLYYLAASAIISTGILFFLLYRVKMEAILSAWRQLNWKWVMAGGIIYCIEVLLMGVRTALLFTDRNTSKGSIVLVSNLHNLANKVLPARIGELSFPFLVRRYTGTDRTYAFSVLIWARVADFYTAITWFLIVYMIHILRQDLPADLGRYWLPIVILWASLPLVFLLLSNGPLSSWLDRLESTPHLWLCGQKHMVIVRIWRETRSVLRMVPRRHVLPKVMLYSVMGWSALYSAFLALTRAIGLDVDLADFLLGASAAILGTMIPVGGIGHWGSLEAGWTFGFMAVGVSYTDAAVSAVIVSVTVFLCALLVGVFSLIVLEVRLRLRQ